MARKKEFDTPKVVVKLRGQSSDSFNINFVRTRFLIIDIFTKNGKSVDLNAMECRAQIV